MTTLQQQHASLWERYIRQECHALKKADRALVDKNWEAPRIPGKKIPREKSKPDFSGVIKGGRHIVFEAKATLNKTSFPFSQISKGQEEHLEAAKAMGAVAFIYVLDGNRDKWVIPWITIQAFRLDRESFPLNPQSPLKKEIGETWLDTLSRTMGDEL
ncbi:MAG: Holliday junction resolvase RecU [Bradymonadaceae bacterium]